MIRNEFTDRFFADMIGEAADSTYSTAAVDSRDEREDARINPEPTMPLMPTSVKVMEPRLSPRINRHPKWIHEVRHGYRALATLRAGSVCLSSVEGRDYVTVAGHIIEAFARLSGREIIIDGELGISGTRSQGKLREVLRDPMLTYYAFDLLWLDGEDIRPLPLLERKRRLLRQVIAACEKHVVFVTHFEAEERTALFSAAVATGYDRVIAKRRDSEYRGGPTADWVSTPLYRPIARGSVRGTVPTRSRL